MVFCSERGRVLVHEVVIYRAGYRAGYQESDRSIQRLDISRTMKHANNSHHDLIDLCIGTIYDHVLALGTCFGSRIDCHRPSTRSNR